MELICLSGGMQSEFWLPLISGRRMVLDILGAAIEPKDSERIQLAVALVLQVMFHRLANVESRPSCRGAQRHVYLVALM